jgi:hypothetical protein
MSVTIAVVVTIRNDFASVDFGEVERTQPDKPVVARRAIARLVKKNVENRTNVMGVIDAIKFEIRENQVMTVKNCSSMQMKSKVLNNQNQAEGRRGIEFRWSVSGPSPVWQRELMVMWLRFAICRRCRGLMIVMMTMGMGRFEQSNHPSGTDSEQQGCREFHPIMRMELHFWQKIAQRDADEDPGRHGECCGNDGRLGPCVLLDAEIKEECPEGAHQCVTQIHQFHDSW